MCYKAIQHHLRGSAVCVVCMKAAGSRLASCMVQASMLLQPPSDSCTDGWNVHCGTASTHAENACHCQHWSKHPAVKRWSLLAPLIHHHRPVHTGCCRAGAGLRGGPGRVHLEEGAGQLRSPALWRRPRAGRPLRANLSAGTGCTASVLYHVGISVTSSIGEHKGGSRTPC